MQKSQKLMLISALLAAVAMLTIGSTLSWLSSTSDPVVNTFSGGAIAIRLDEALVGPDGEALVGDEARRVMTNHYKYVAGAVVDKDPTPTVLRGSEECYVFLLVENELNDKFTMNYDTASWHKVAESGTKSIYAYHTTVDAEKAPADVKLNPIFTKVTISPELTAEDIDNLGEKKLCVTAFAVQTANVDVPTAVDLAVAQFELTGADTTIPPIE